MSPWIATVIAIACERVAQRLGGISPPAEARDYLSRALNLPPPVLRQTGRRRDFRRAGT